MTVKELIDELKYYDEDKEVEITLLEDDEREYEGHYFNFIYQTEETVYIEIT